MLLTIIPWVAGLGLLMTIVLMALRYSWGQAGTARPAGGGFWVLSFVALWLWWSALSAGLKANAKVGTYQALSALPVVTAEDIRTKPELVGRPVVVQDQAFCHETLSQGQKVLATLVSYSGQEEIEGEEYDRIEVRSYGKDREVARFSLGGLNSPVRVDTDFLTVVPAEAPQRITKQTNEYSPAAGGNLEEYQDIATIPCEAMVSVTGLVVKQGDFYMLEPLNPNVALLSDRPWSGLLDYAHQRAQHHTRGVWLWFFAALAVGLSQLAMGWAARK